MHGMHKLAVDVTLTQIISKKGINRHGKRSITDMYKEYTHIEGMKVMELLDPKILKNLQKRGALQTINSIEEKKLWENKRKEVHIWNTTKVLHT